MHNKFASALCIAAFALVACGGGGGGRASGMPTAPAPSTGSGNLPLSEMVGSSLAFVNPSNHKTLYFLDTDTATGGTCTGGCLAFWPVFAPTSGTQSAGNITIITRSDGMGQQFAYLGHPLYTFSGDSGPDQANGDNVALAGGHWHIARPASSSGGSNGGMSGGCTGPYC